MQAEDLVSINPPPSQSSFHPSLEFDQRGGGGVSIAAPLNPCLCPPLQLIMHILD